MAELKYVFGPVPSRRLGRSLGVSPIPRKTCNYSCVYCQLGRTDKMTNNREEFYKVSDIITELQTVINSDIEFDVISVVGEGEPTLYSKLGDLLIAIKKITTKPVAVITNGSLLFDKAVQNDLQQADIVLPSFDAYNDLLFKKINRPYGTINFTDMYHGLVEFSRNYTGQLWLEIMLIDAINDDEQSICQLKKLIDNICYDKLYLNTPVRPPAENWVTTISPKNMATASEILGGIAIDHLNTTAFACSIKDDYEAILAIIQRHPMNTYEIASLLDSRKCECSETIFTRLNSDTKVTAIDYKGIVTYRLN